MRNELRRSEKGFTLVELLVVIAIIAVLATIILPGMGNIRWQANFLKCGKNLDGLYKGLVMYEAQYKAYPAGTDARGKAFWNILRDPNNREAPLYKQDGLFVCPIKKEKAGPGVCSYRGPAFDVGDALGETDIIGGELAANHDPKNTAKPVNALTWGGKVIEVKPADPDWVEVTGSGEDGTGLQD